MSRLRLLILSSLFVLLGTSAIAGQSSSAPKKAETKSKDGWPDTREGAVAKRWVEGFSKGEKAMRAALQELLTKEALAKTSMDARMERYRASYERMGPLMLIRIEKSEPGELVAVLAGSDYSETPFTFKVQTEAPYKLISVTRLEQRQQRHGQGGGFMHGQGH